MCIVREAPLSNMLYGAILSFFINDRNEKKMHSNAQKWSLKQKLCQKHKLKPLNKQLAAWISPYPQTFFFFFQQNKWGEKICNTLKLGVYLFGRDVPLLFPPKKKKKKQFPLI